jgi:hypothetical protein
VDVEVDEAWQRELARPHSPHARRRRVVCLVGAVASVAARVGCAIGAVSVTVIAQAKSPRERVGRGGAARDMRDRAVAVWRRRVDDDQRVLKNLELGRAAAIQAWRRAGTVDEGAADREHHFPRETNGLVGGTRQQLGSQKVRFSV